MLLERRRPLGGTDHTASLYSITPCKYASAVGERNAVEFLNLFHQLSLQLSSCIIPHNNKQKEKTQQLKEHLTATLPSFMFFGGEEGNAAQDCQNHTLERQQTNSKSLSTKMQVLRTFLFLSITSSDKLSRYLRLED